MAAAKSRVKRKTIQVRKNGENTSLGAKWPLAFSDGIAVPESDDETFANA
jgi:hypothetical protein